MKYLIVVVVALVTPILARPQAPQQTPQVAAEPHPQVATQPHPQVAARSQPQAAPQAQGGANVTPVTIVNQAEVVGPDGSYNYSYDASNGIHVEQGGYVKKSPEPKSLDPNNPDATGDVQVIQGAYSYTAPDGQQISLRYVADENGFQPEGDHLPTAPPVPEGIARSLEQQPQQQGQDQQQLGQHQVGQQHLGQQLQHTQQQPQPLAAVSPTPSQPTTLQ